MPDIEIVINDIKFTPRPDCNYKHNYVAYVQIIKDPSRWGEVVPAEYLNRSLHPEVNEEWVAKALWRKVILSDLWFIVYFILGVPASIANTPFFIDMCRKIEEGPKTKTLDVWSRGHGKSSCITKAETIQYHLKNPEHCTCIFSFNKPTAEAFVKSIKEAYELPFMMSCFPDVLYNAEERKDSSSWSVQNGISIKRKNRTRTEATVMASGLIEGMLTGKHFERRIYDDFETADLARTPEQLDLCYSQFEMSSYLGTKTEVDIIRLIGTIYSHMGPIVKLMAKKITDSEGVEKPIYHSRIVPGTVGGEWDGKPVLWSQEILDHEKTLDHYPMQVLCDPTPTKLRSFKSECLIEIEPHKIPKNILKFMIVDPAGDNSNSKKGDCWAVPVIGIDASQVDELGGANIYITNAVISQMGKDAAVAEIARIYLASGVIQAIGIEKQPGAVNYLDSQIKEVLASRGRRVSIEDKSLVLLPTGGRNKKEKIQNALQWRFSNGKIHISTDVPIAYRDRLRQEMDKFPYWHDDFLDSIAYFFDLIKCVNLTAYNALPEYDYTPRAYSLATAVG